MTLREINNKYYDLYGDLNSARAFLPPKQLEETASVLLKQYREEVANFLDMQFVETALSKFELKFRVKMYAPRRLFLRWNKVAKKLLKQYTADFELYLAQLEKDAAEAHAETADVKEQTSLVAVSTNVAMSEVKDDVKKDV